MGISLANVLAAKYGKPPQKVDNVPIYNNITLMGQSYNVLSILHIGQSPDLLIVLKAQAKSSS
jgi:hypothetical protein